jgi:hypothetical protein
MKSVSRAKKPRKSLDAVLAGVEADMAVIVAGIAAHSPAAVRSRRRRPAAEPARAA